jgi:hypothetical protein
MNQYQIENRKYQISRYLSFVICYWSLATGHWSLVFAQDASFTASVDRNRLALGERLEITFTLEGSTSGKNFRPPSFNDFLVLSGPNQSTSMQFVNGQMSSSVSYSYILQPRDEGKFTIGAAAIEVGGKQLQTQPITIDVIKGAPPQAKQQGHPPAADDIGRQIGDNLFVKVTIDKSRIYQGEQITATYKLYTRVNIVNYGVTRVPSLTGFWSEDLEVPKQIQLSTEVYEGKQYRVGVLKKIALFPQRSGSLEIDPMEVECIVQVQTRRRSNDFFDQFFSDPFFGGVTNVSHKIRSEPLKISVLSLPPNPPSGFSGAVGKFSMDTWLDRKETKTNESVTLKVKISGRGNLKLIEPPSVNIPATIEQYDPKISDNITRQGEQIAGSRTFEFLLIPRNAGELKIPSFPYSYYDIEKRSYVTLTSPELYLSVERGSEPASSLAGLRKEDVRLLGEDIRFIKSGNVELRRKGDRFVGSPMFYTLSFSPILAFFGFILFVKQRARTLGDLSTWRSRRANKMAQRRLAEAKRFLHEKKNPEFFAEVSRAIWGYTSDKLGIPVAELSIESLRRDLEARGVTPDIVNQTVAALEQCEFVRFATSVEPSKADAHRMGKKMYREAVRLIAAIESELR